jgi:hypothetical protein
VDEGAHHPSIALPLVLFCSCQPISGESSRSALWIRTMQSGTKLTPRSYTWSILSLLSLVLHEERSFREPLSTAGRVFPQSPPGYPQASVLPQFSLYLFYER